MGKNTINPSVASAGSAWRSPRRLRMVPPDALGVATRLAVQRVRDAGISLAPLLKAAGLSISEVDNRDARIPVASQIIFLKLTAKALQEPLLGFRLACDCDLRAMGLLHYAAGAAETLGDALHRFERYCSIVNEGIVLKFLTTGKPTIELGYVGVARHSDTQQMEFLVTTVIRSCRALASCDLNPTAVHLVHPTSKTCSDLERYFGCRVTFGAEIDGIVFDKHVPQLRLVGADPYLNEILLEYCEQTLANRRTNSSSLRNAIENVITPLLPHGEANFNEVARKLGVGRRTLARRLKAEELSFSEILKQLRSDLITRYLSEAHLSISQVAWLVGFRSVAAFSHSCKRWYGMSPKAFRGTLTSS
jgi:AraC-like DNA-binding protein